MIYGTLLNMAELAGPLAIPINADEFWMHASCSAIESPCSLRDVTFGSEVISSGTLSDPISRNRNSSRLV